MYLFEIIFYFLLWTFTLYWIHRLAHIIPLVKKYHFNHHKVVNTDTIKWKWNNLLLYNDTWYSTIDIWLTEVLPTCIISYITGQWWLVIIYYFWASLLQERIEHNRNFDIPILTSGKWHLIHHIHGSYNYGLFTTLWDRVFKTNNDRKQLVPNQLR